MGQEKCYNEIMKVLEGKNNKRKDTLQFASF